jgi:hypothetical protein
MILPVILYGFETWSPTLREKNTAGVFENRVLRRILESKKVEVTRDWRSLHNNELYNMYYSSNMIRMINSRMMTWEKILARMRGEEEYLYWMESQRERSH